MVAWLIESGARVTGQTLGAALFGGDAAFVERLADHATADAIAGALSSVDDEALFEKLASRATQMPARAVALAVGVPWRLRAVLSRGAAVDEPDADGWTALHRAARSGDVASARLLLEHHATVDARVANGMTPLHVAAEAGHLPIVELLVGAGADRSATTKTNRTPRALAFNRHDAITKYLEAPVKTVAAPAQPMAVGSKVSHPTFGLGTVLKRDGDKIRVKFDTGEKTLLAKVLVPA
jgi:hypothetical protein